jgi:hypothetical protein
MSQKSFNSMNQMPSHGNGSNANVREGYHQGQMRGQREGYHQGMGTSSGGRDQCSFPAPAQKRNYCHPAPFANNGGGNYFRLTDAYGSSTPSHM